MADTAAHLVAKVVPDRFLNLSPVPQADRDEDSTGAPSSEGALQGTGARGYFGLGGSGVVYTRSPFAALHTPM